MKQIKSASGATFTGSRQALTALAAVIDHHNSQQMKALDLDNLNENTNPEDLGEFIARVYRWNGDQIAAAFMAALTEANFHTLRAELEPIINKHLNA